MHHLADGYHLIGFSMVGGHRVWLEERHTQNIEDVQQNQQEPRNEGAGEEVADRDGLGRKNAHLELRLLIGGRHNIAKHHEDDRWRNDLTQGAGSADRTRRYLRRIATLQHCRQRQQTHRDNRGADNTGTRGQQHSDQRDRNTKAATQCSEQGAECLEQFLGDTSALKRHAHKHEQRHSNQSFVGHDAENSIRQAR